MIKKEMEKFMMMMISRRRRRRRRRRRNSTKGISRWSKAMLLKITKEKETQTYTNSN